jgi:DNA-binding transcriptional MerR regulator
MKLYQIADLEQLTGIKAHTIRIWEKRYNLIEPARTLTNRRRYNEDQVKKLLNISALLCEGHKISKIAELKDRELTKKITDLHELGESDAVSRSFINELTVAMLSFDEATFEKSFCAAVTRFGLYDALLNVFYPLLGKIGVMWATDQVMPVQEHFASCIIKRKLMASIDGLPPARARRKKFLLFLPPEESHEIGLLFSNYLIRSRGYETIYLGQNVPYANIAAVIKHTRPDYLLTFFIRNRNPGDVSRQLHDHFRSYPGLKLLVSGHSETLSQLKRQKNVEILHSPPDLAAYL